MNKKFLSAILFGALMVGSAGTFTSCKDYDDDIDSLQKQIDATNVTLGELQALIKSGAVITSVSSTNDGISIVLSDGKSYTLNHGKDGVNGTNGTDGKDGVDGKSAVAWTIGADGYWYEDGVKTEYKAIGVDGKDGVDGEDGKDGINGEDGKDGVDGEDGKDGIDGKDGKYYYPNVETGCFDIYQDGKKIEATQISWKAAGVSAVLSGNTLTLSGVDGDAQTVVIYVGKQLGSVAFIPEVMSSEVVYPTTTNPFYHLATYLDETKYNTNTKQLIAQTNWDKSNVVAMLYRLNPDDAYVKDAIASFLNRGVTTRAVAGDKADLLNVKGQPTFANGVATLNATINASKQSSSKKDIVALQVWVGQNAVTSDYVHVKSVPVKPLLVDSMATVGGTLKTFYSRIKSIKGATENDAFVKEFVKLEDPANLSFKYDDKIDLKDYVGLYSDADKFLTELGFYGMSYEFSLPAEYKSNDTQKTNQQWYVELSDGVVKANAANLENGLTPAIGRTPVVRVDAYMTSNTGARKLVASSYIKLSITANDPGPGEDADPITAEISAIKQYEYHALKSGTMSTVAGEMDWRAVNNILYGSTGLTSQTFWNYYGGNTNTYEVKVTTKDKNAREVVVVSGNGLMGDMYTYSGAGFDFQVLLNQGDTQTSNIKIGVYNGIKTENTYMDMNSLGAEYIVTLTIKSDNVKTRGDIVLTQTVYVKEDCKNFDYNPLYYVASYQGYNNCVIVKGQLKSTWEMSSNVSEHFKMIDNKNIFEYYNTINNVTDLNFAWAANTTGVTYDAAVQEVKLKDAMTEPYEVKNMTYKTTLTNGEYCDFNYNIVFQNPFVAGTSNAVSINDGIGTNTVATMPQVGVKDNDGAAIYSYSTTSNALVLSSKATNTYKVAVPTVVYSFKEDAAYKNVVSQMGTKATLSVDASTGVVTWENLGTTLQGTHKLTVIATVTFNELSIVKCNIPVNLIGK